MVKLTKRVVDALAASKADQVIFDEELAGFGVRVKPSGAKSWLIQYRNAHGRSRRFTLGPVAKLPPEEARKKARRLFVDIDGGADPADARASLRKAATVSQLCDDYLAAGKGRIKASTLAADKGRIERHVKPLLGSKVVAGLRAPDIEKLIRDIEAGKTADKTPAKMRPRGGVTRGGPAAAARTAEMLGTILQRAVRDGILAANPVRGVKRPKVEARKPLFSFGQVGAVGAAMREIQSEEGDIYKVVRPATMTALRAVQFLILTGCRRMEALTLKWGDVDISGRCLRLRDSKTGAQVRPIGRAALQLLASFQPAKAQKDDFVFPGAAKGHFVGLPKAWARIAKRSKTDDVSLHGLRHWFASAGAEMNYSEFTLAALLGHRVKGVTARYANTPDAAVLAAADRISLQLGDALSGNGATKVIAFPG